eukprot:COSAG01_NODE_54215_length_333_cov_1.482906_1_plen_54_part_10
MNRAFQDPEEEPALTIDPSFGPFSRCPSELDVLITHGPPADMPAAAHYLRSNPS